MIGGSDVHLSRLRCSRYFDGWCCFNRSLRRRLSTCSGVSPAVTVVDAVDDVDAVVGVGGSCTCLTVSVKCVFSIGVVTGGVAGSSSSCSGIAGNGDSTSLDRRDFGGDWITEYADGSGGGFAVGGRGNVAVVAFVVVVAGGFGVVGAGASVGRVFLGGDEKTSASRLAGAVLSDRLSA